MDMGIICIASEVYGSEGQNSLLGGNITFAAHDQRIFQNI